MSDYTIGGTAAAAIVCDHESVRYFGRSAWDVYLRWTGQEARDEPTEMMRWGTHLESGILDWYQETQRPGWEMSRAVRLAADGWRHGSLDAMMVKAKPAGGYWAVVVDAKRAVTRYDSWGNTDEPRVPLGYQVQLAWYALLAEAAGYDVVACDLAIYDPLADASGQAPGRVRSLAWRDLRPLALHWLEIVRAEVERWAEGGRPEFDGSDAATRWLAVHAEPPTGGDRDERPADEEERELIEEWRRATEEAKDADKRRKALAQELIDRAQGRRLRVGGAYVQPQATGSSLRFDSKAFREAHPELWEQFQKPSSRGVTLRGYRF